MNPVWVVSVYGSALVLALALLYRFRARWYCHALSVVLALVIGSIRFPDQWRPHDLLVGFVFVLLFFWGIGGAFVKRRHTTVTVARHA